MNRSIRLAGALVGLLLCVALAAAGDSPVIGCWRCESGGETSMMELRTDNTAIFDGEPAQYALTPDAIQIQTEFGPIDYPYRMEGDKLVLVFPGEIRIPCTKVKCGEGAAPVPQTTPGGREETGAPPTGGSQGSGNEYLLQGTLCHWSGSSSSYSGSGYSHSLRVSFDGQGNFRTGSESSFDSQSGLAYGQGDGSGGTYRVVGDQVQLQFNDGTTGVASVERREADGRITALKYEGNLYGPELCD